MHAQGATTSPTEGQAVTTGFNPHPVRTQGATHHGGGDHRHGQVSILTLCEHRVQRPGMVGSPARPSSFNPHPVRTQGATGRRPTGRHRLPSFNPHPVRTQGATGRRPTGRHRLPSFNPHPVRTQGATGRRPTGRHRLPSFNPHPVRTQGATASFRENPHCPVVDRDA